MKFVKTLGWLLKFSCGVLYWGSLPRNFLSRSLGERSMREGAKSLMKMMMIVRCVFSDNYCSYLIFFSFFFHLFCSSSFLSVCWKKEKEKIIATYEDVGVLRWFFLSFCFENANGMCCKFDQNLGILLAVESWTILVSVAPENVAFGLGRVYLLLLCFNFSWDIVILI